MAELEQRMNQSQLRRDRKPTKPEKVDKYIEDSLMEIKKMEAKKNDKGKYSPEEIKEIKQKLSSLKARVKTKLEHRSKRI